MHFKRMKDHEFMSQLLIQGILKGLKTMNSYSNFIFMVSIFTCNLMPFKSMKEHELMNQPLNNLTQIKSMIDHEFVSQPVLLIQFILKGLKTMTSYSLTLSLT